MGSGPAAATQPGLLVYIMVDSVAATVDLILANGGEIVQPIGGMRPRLRLDFAIRRGMCMGIYQEPG